MKLESLNTEKFQLTNGEMKAVLGGAKMTSTECDSETGKPTGWVKDGK